MRSLKKNEDFTSLALIIETVLGVNVTHDRSRKRHVVNAKMIYAFLLHRKGYGCSVIADALKCHHSTILYYFKEVPDHLETDPGFLDEYEAVEKENNDRTLAHLEMRVLLSESDKKIIDLKMEVLKASTAISEANTANIRLSRINKVQAEECVRLQKQLKGSVYTEKRLFPLYQIVKERTTEAKEEVMLSKLKKLYN